MGGFWQPTVVQSATLLAFFAGLVAFFIATIIARIGRKGEAGKKETSRASMLGVLIQMLAMGLTSGPMQIQGNWADGWLSWRTIAVILLMAASVGIFLAASKAMGDNWAIVARVREDHRLVTNGPFAIVRHPIYLALFLFMLALAITAARESRLVAAVPIYMVGTLIRINIEEAMLRNHFGAAYADYAKRVKRFLPGIF